MIFDQASLSLNKVWLWAFLVIIPYIIIYLTKPRPQKKTVPSLMFMLSVQGRVKRNAFLNKFLRNFLFFIQVLIFSLLAFSLSNPVLSLEANLPSNNVVIIIDGSASMHVKDGSLTRFENALDEAKKHVGRKTSIILAEDAPLVLLERESKKRAEEVLAGLKPRATSTNIGDALMQAADILGGKKGKVVLISDFTSNQGSDIIMAKRKLVTQDIDIQLINVGKALSSNIGIVGMKFEKDVVVLAVKNYYREDKESTVALINNEKELNVTKLQIKSGSIEELRFSVMPGINRMNIIENDALLVDNTLTVSFPERRTIRAIFITNKANQYMVSALTAVDDVELTVAEPPVLPKLDHDLIIIGDIDTSLILPGTFSDIKALVHKGSKLIIMAQDDLNVIDTKGLLPFTPHNILGLTSINKKIENEFTKDIEFGTQTKHLSGEAETDALVIVESDAGAPLLVYSERKLGVVIYYGIYDEYTDFTDSIDYPVFWYDLTGYLFNRKQLDQYNFKTGTILTINKQDVKTPSGTTRVSQLLLDEAGVYEYGGIKVGVNVLDVRESDLSDVETDIFTSDKKHYADELEKRPTPFNLTILLIIFAFLALTVEFAYLKRRGDL